MDTRERAAYGVAEVAKALGANPRTVAKWSSRGKLPPPDERLATGPVWLASTIEPWLAEHREIRG